MTVLTKEQMREARLKALGQHTTTTSVISQPSDRSSPVEKKQALLNTSRVLTSSDYTYLQKIMYRGGGATEEDMLRWYSQGFNFCTTPFFGLKQGNGGPCGILAAIQAEIIREMIFSSTELEEKVSLPVESEVDLNLLLATAITNILFRAADGNALQLFYLSPFSISKPLLDWDDTDLVVVSFISKEDAKLDILKHLDIFHSPSGSIVFLVSLMLTRGLDQLRSDMDDIENTLIGQFGHCNQDLINLLLTGKATSNVMDGEMIMGDDAASGGGYLSIRGVAQRSVIGYLTHLEALRYCQVGSYLKIPTVPIWVIGSTSHFTVLFSLNRKVNEESFAEKLLSTLQRCFKAVDRDECGYIPASSLKEALSMINKHEDFDKNVMSRIDAILNNETDIARLRGHLQIDGEIILWSAFWKNISRLMMMVMSGDNSNSSGNGATLDDLIQQAADEAASAMAGGGGGGGDNSTATAPLMLEYNSNYNNNNNTMNGSSGGRMRRSDSELARLLQAQMDNMGDGEMMGEDDDGMNEIMMMEAYNNNIFLPNDFNNNNHTAINSVPQHHLMMDSNNNLCNVSTTTTVGHTSPAPSSSSLDVIAGNNNDVDDTGYDITGASYYDTTVNYEDNHNTKTINNNDNDCSNNNMSYGYDVNNNNNYKSYFSNNESTATSGRMLRSDSELARQLQEEWDAEELLQQQQYDNSGALNTAMIATTASPSPQKAAVTTESINSQQIRAHVHRSDSIASDTTAEDFSMYHFNGLESNGRLAKLTQFRLFVRSSVDAVGVSIALEGPSAGTGGAPFICPIEEVLRTRWPGCRAHWMEQQTPPSID